MLETEVTRNRLLDLSSYEPIVDPPARSARQAEGSCWQSLCGDSRSTSPARQPLLGNSRSSQESDIRNAKFINIFRVLIWKRHLVLLLVGLITFVKRPIVTSFSDKRYLQARIENPSNWYQLDPVDAGKNATSQTRWIYSMSFNETGEVSNKPFFQPDLGWEWTKAIVGFDMHDRHYFLEWLWNVHVLGAGFLYLGTLTWRTRKPGPWYLAALNMIRRVIWNYMLTLNLRDLCYPVTTLAVYPPSYSEYVTPNFDDFWSSAWSRMFDFAGQSYSDCIYSGHSAIMTILAMAAIHRIGGLRFPLWAQIAVCTYYVAFALFAYFILLLKQMHYTVDVAVAIIVCVAVYTNKVWDYEIFRDLQPQDLTRREANDSRPETEDIVDQVPRIIADRNSNGTLN